MAIPDEKSARKGEMSSCNVNASARGLAWAACIMANKGVDPDGKRIMSEESWKKMHLNPKVAPDVFGGRSAFSLAIQLRKKVEKTWMIYEK